MFWVVIKHWNCDRLVRTVWQECTMTCHLSSSSNIDIQCQLYHI